MIEETGWRWDEVRTTKLRRVWMLFRYWAERAAGPPVPPPPSDAEIAAAMARLPWGKN